MSQNTQPDQSNSDARAPLTGVVIVSALAIAFLFWLIYFKGKVMGHAAWVDSLPWLNATFNSCAALCLVRGYLQIKAGQIDSHRRSMLGAFTFSTLFLLSYVAYHALHEESRFPGQGLVRPIYFFILISHICLSVVSLPMVLSSLFLGLTRRFEVHKKVARWTFPLWLYISVTGVLIVLFLKAYGA